MGVPLPPLSILQVEICRSFSRFNARFRSLLVESTEATTAGWW